MSHLVTRRMTLRMLALAAVLAASAGANAANYDPRIAWTSYEGKGDTIYLANADGSLKVAVYKTNKTIISGLDLGDGRVAFTESGVLKVFSYTVTANGIVASAPVALDTAGAPDQGAARPDFSPDGSRLLYLRWVQNPVYANSGYQEIRVVASDGSAPPKVLVTAADITDTRNMVSPRWLNGNEFAFGRGGGSPYWSSVMLASLDAGMNLTAPPLQLFANTDPAFTSEGLVGWEDFDISHTSPSIVLSCNTARTGFPPRAFMQYDLIEGTFNKRFSDYGWNGHFQAGDTSIVYNHLPTSGGSVGNAVYRWVAATNRSTAISGKGGQAVRYVDARP